MPLVHSPVSELANLIRKSRYIKKIKKVMCFFPFFLDGVRSMDNPTVQRIVQPSSGVHVTLPNYYSPRNYGMIDPSTSDGRVIYFLPWEGNTIAGTTDSPTELTYSPMPTEGEIQWILDEIRSYLSPGLLEFFILYKNR